MNASLSTATENVRYLADTNGLSTVSTTALQLMGTALSVLIGWRLIEHYGKKEWGAMITAVIAAVLPVWFIYDPTSALTFLKSIATKIGA